MSNMDIKIEYDGRLWNKESLIWWLYKDKKLSLAAIGNIIGCSRQNVQKIIKKLESERQNPKKASSELALNLKSGEISFKIKPLTNLTSSEFVKLLQSNVGNALYSMSQIREYLNNHPDFDVIKRFTFEKEVLSVLAHYTKLLAKDPNKDVN